MKPKDRDSLHRFLFEQMPVRGEIVHMDASWRAALEHMDYPQVIRDLLGEAMAATVLLASTLKFKGALTLQLQGDGNLKLLIVQCTSDRHIRGLARLAEELDDVPAEELQQRFSGGSLKSLAGENARMVITIEQESGQERYQGIVPLEGASLSACFEEYFERSEQLPTRLFLHASAATATGMLLQILPGHEEAEGAWEHVTALGETITGQELIELDAKSILHRLYHEDDVRLFESLPVAFRCSCSRDRISSMLRGLGADEAHAILEEQGRIHVSCEFCGKAYEFDSVDVDELFATDVSHSGSRVQH